MFTLANESALMMHDYEELNPIIDTLNDGGLILYPTDTVWGIGCDATNEAAVNRVFELKQHVESLYYQFTSSN